MAEGFIGLPVRRGTPQHIGGLIDVVRSPAYATSIGLILHAIRRYKDPIYIATHIQKSILQRGLYGMRNFFSKTRRWFDDFF
jgi:cell division protein FtsA